MVSVEETRGLCRRMSESHSYISLTASDNSWLSEPDAGLAGGCSGGMVVSRPWKISGDAVHLVGLKASIGSGVGTERYVRIYRCMILPGINAKV